MSNIFGTTDLRGWLKMPFEGTTSLFRTVKTGSLQEAAEVASQAVRIIAGEGCDGSSLVSYNAENCTISIHVGVAGEISQEYYDLTDKIDRVVGHVRS